ncbi:serine threonine protein kinase [Sarocladium implicatum]|nr:serine threonine protein kinase [Sarocladium implicatum]
MEPASFAFGLITVFKDTYLTIKFIRNTVRTLKGFEGEQEQMAIKFNVQILFLRNLSRIFCAADSNEVDFELLEGVSDWYLRTIQDILRQHQRILGEYSRTAAYLDHDYKRFLDLSRQGKIESVREAWLIEEDKETQESPDTLPDASGSQTSISVRSHSAKRSGFLRLFGGRKKDEKPVAAASKPARSNVLRLDFQLPPNMRWLFKRGELQKTLDSLEYWNGGLKDLVSSLLDGFGFYRNIELQKRLRSDGNENLFPGHLAIRGVADGRLLEAQEVSEPEDKLIPWQEAMERSAEPRILSEFKGISFSTTPENPSQTREPSNVLNAVKMMYGPQLARVLQAAGNHSLRTLPFNSYSWDDESSRYIYLFDYPPGTSTRPPQSLDDLIRSDKPQFRLELQQRFLVAQKMASAIGAFHADGWLHKNIRAHAIKFFFTADRSECDFSNPYLTDFEFSRPVQGLTRLLPQAIDIEHELYRHPDRHGMPGISFNKLHDIYSLGVVLLEIGLWTTAKQLYDDVVEYDYHGVVPGDGVPPKKIREVFLQEARERLAHRLGPAYRDAVVACLSHEWHDHVDSRELFKEFNERVVQKVDIRAFIGP